jgi:hypothetical protein
MSARQWYRQLYAPEVLSKSGAIPAWPPTSGLAAKLLTSLPAQADDTVVPGMLRIFMFDEADRLIGGSLLSVDESDRTLRVRAAAYESQSRARKELAVRGMHEMIVSGSSLGLTHLSYGDDPNLFGVDVTLGLARFKVSIGMHPVPSKIGGTQLIKVFADTCRRLEAESPDEALCGLLCFSLPACAANTIAAGLQLGADSAASGLRLPKGMPLLRFDRPAALARIAS